MRPELGIREQRALQAVEVRQDTDEIVFEGYASVFNAPYEVLGGPDEGGWTEVVDPDAFNRTLKGDPDVPLKVEHDGITIARTPKTMQLSTDKKGLKVRALLDPASPLVQTVASAVKRQDMDEMSFAFWTVRQEWDEERMIRRLLEVNIDRGDVSIVSAGASPTTSATILSDLSALESLDRDKVLAEVRSLDNPLQRLMQARSVLGELILEFQPHPVLSVREAAQIANLR